MFPRSWISFGVLHGMAVMLIVARLDALVGRWRWPLGWSRWCCRKLVSDPFFDSRWTNWVGLVTHLPVTEDYVPLLPWLGVVWWGRRRALAAGAAARWFAGRAARAARAAGRARALVLSFYMLHQPVLIGALMLVALRDG